MKKYDYVKIIEKDKPSNFVYGVWFENEERPYRGCMWMSNNFWSPNSDKFFSPRWKFYYSVQIVGKSEIIDFKKKQIESMLEHYKQKIDELNEIKLNLALEMPTMLIDNFPSL